MLLLATTATARRIRRSLDDDSASQTESIIVAVC